MTTLNRGSETRSRINDRFLVIPTWNDVSKQQSFSPTPEESSSVWSAEHTHSKVFAQIVEQGCWLQQAVAERWPETGSIAAALSCHADFNNSAFEDVSRERIAANYLLWPFHAARYYGYLPVSCEERLVSREHLCRIQKILYNNMRGTLDVMRLWFNAFCDNDIKPYVMERAQRLRWRPAALLENLPDLCAVDFLAEHILEVMKSRSLVRRAIESIQSLSLNPHAERVLNEHTDVCAAVVKAFEELRVAQMTVFYNPNPVDVKDRDEIPLYELVHEMSDSNPVPAKLIPFGNDERLAKNFRKLASAIYSIKDRKAFPSFFSQRQHTIGHLGKPTNFISDGAITSFFLSTKPPLHDNGHHTQPLDEQLPGLWPLWYKKALNDFDFDGDPPDWSSPSWWDPIGCDELMQRLFPGPPMDNGQFHHNYHMSAYWDDVVVKTNQFVDSIRIPDKHPTGEATFNYLMELLLRREYETRTSFFFALAQTFEKNSRLCQFVGGTFLGLERPGIPFSIDRFEALAARVRGLVMAVAHYTTTQAMKRSRWQAEQERSGFGTRVDLIVRLLRGDDPRFPRSGHLLFASPVSENSDLTDHDYRPGDGVGWTPSRHQIKSVFTTASDLHERPRESKFFPLNCSDTWKALFFLGGTADKNNNTLELLLQRKSLKGEILSFSDRPISCHKCFSAAVEFLISEEMYATLADKIRITDEPILLPSRPGIRFLIALCRFIVDIQAQASPENTTITQINFLPRAVVFDFDKPKLVQRLWSRHDAGKLNEIHTAGIFRMLENGKPFTVKADPAPWEKFLNNRNYASKLKLEKNDYDTQLTLRW